MFISYESRVTCHPPVIVTQDTGGDEEAAGVRPGDRLVLSPPSSYHNTERKYIFSTQKQSLFFAPTAELKMSQKAL